MYVFAHYNNFTHPLNSEKVIFIDWQKAED